MISMTMMKGSEIVGFGSFNIPKNFDKIIADNKDLTECTSRIECETTLPRITVLRISKGIFECVFQSVKEQHCV